MVTAEVALALPALIVVVAALVTVVVAVAAQLRCVAAAREGARAAARGEPAAVVHQLASRAAPAGARITVGSAGKTVTVSVTARIRPLGVRLAQFTVHGEATGLREPDGAEPVAGAGLLLALPVRGRLRSRSGCRWRLPQPTAPPRRFRWGCRRWLAQPTAPPRRSRSRSRWRADRGSGTVYVVAMLGVLGALTAGAVLVGKAHVAQQQAATAADLGALAGARALVDGTGDPCAAAAAIVHRNGAQLTGCVVEGENLLVSTTVPVGLGSLGLQNATARARAGPVPE